MASRTCLSRFPAVLEQSLLGPRQCCLFSQHKSFSTTSSRHATPPKKGKAAAHLASMPKKGRRTLRIKKDPPPHDSTIGTPEERKAFRTRLVLSNTNANDVTTLKELNTENMHAEESIGKVFKLPGGVVDSLRTLGAFKRGQGWNNFKQPSFLMTKEAWDIAQLMKSPSDSGKVAETFRSVIVGDKRSGKSVLLLQIMSMALIKGWIVLNIPESRELTDSMTTDYTPLRDVTPLQYMQRTYTAQLLTKMAQVNRTVLKDVKTTRDHGLPLKSTELPSLLQLAELGAQDLDLSWPIFEMIWEELSVPNSSISHAQATRPPVLFCADNISYLFSPTKYLTLSSEQSLKPVHPFDLLLPKHFIDHLSGARTLTNGGIILGAVSSSNKVTCPALEVGISMGEARNSDSGLELKVSDFWSPLAKIDRRVLDHLTNLHVTRVAGLPKDHTRELIEYWALSGLVRDHVKEDFLGQKWALSGGGIIGELERNVIKGLAIGA